MNDFFQFLLLVFYSVGNGLIIGCTRSCVCAVHYHSRAGTYISAGSLIESTIAGWLGSVLALWPVFIRMKRQNNADRVHCWGNKWWIIALIAIFADDDIITWTILMITIIIVIWGNTTITYARTQLYGFSLYLVYFYSLQLVYDVSNQKNTFNADKNQFQFSNFIPSKQPSMKAQPIWLKKAILIFLLVVQNVEDTRRI